MSPSYKIIRTTISAAVCSLTAVVFFILITALAPMFMGYRTLVILSGSMAPTIAMGSVSIAEPVPSNSLAVGQAIAYAPSPNAQVPIVHRIVNIRQKDGVRYYTTQGDANPAADAEISLPPTAWRVWYSVPMAGYIIAYATSPAGNLLLIVIPLICLGVLKITDWLKANAPMRLPWINSKHSTMI